MIFAWVVVCAFAFFLGFFLGTEWVMNVWVPPRSRLPSVIPQVIRRGPDRIQRTFLTPYGYNPGPDWTYYPELKEWRR